MRYCLFGLHQPLSNDLGVCRARTHISLEPSEPPQRPWHRLSPYPADVADGDVCEGPLGCCCHPRNCLRSCSLQGTPESPPETPKEQLQLSAEAKLPLGKSSSHFHLSSAHQAPSNPSLWLSNAVRSVQQLNTETCCCEAPSPASPALVVVQRAELCWGALPNCSTQRNTSISSGTTQTTASEHFWGSSDSLGVARSGFPSDPFSSAIWTSWDWVTSAHEDLAAKGRVGSTLLFFFLVEYQKDKQREKASSVFLAG